MFIGINYDGGFCVADSKTTMEKTIQETRQVVAGFYDSIGEAYMALMDVLIDRNIAAETTPVAPRYIDFCSLPFYVHPNMKTVDQPTGRVFVLWNKEYCGVYTDIGIAVNDFIHVGDMVLIEVGNELEAVKLINNKYKKLIFPLLPELVKPIPFLNGPIKTNVLFRMPYVDILKNLYLPNEIRALNPYAGTDGPDCAPDNGLINVVSVNNE